MSVTLIQSKEFRCNGLKVYEFKICSCLFDVTLHAIKTISMMNQYIDMIYQVSEQLYFNYHQGCYVACCKTFIEWAARNEDGDLYDECSKVCPHEFPDAQSVNCLDLLEFGLSDVCFGCNVVVSINFLIQKLHTVIVSENDDESSSSDEN